MKRPKISEATRGHTIAERIEADEYTSLEDVREDVEATCSEMLASGSANGGSVNRQLQAGVLAFRKLVNTLLNAESLRLRPSQPNDKRIKIEDTGESNFKLTEAALDDGHSGKTVLTLYGNAQGPKQLFSSLQQPIQASRGRGGGKGQILGTDDLRATAPLREAALPNLITASKIIPTQADDAVSEKASAPTIGELFAPSSAIPQLSPPKPPKQSTTRGSRIGWVDSNSLPKTGRKGTYTTQNLTTGHWLGYNNVNIPQEPSSPIAKRKQRDRALSTGEARPAPTEEATAALQQAKEDALFRTAFSTFAPTRDDSIAIIPEETKNRVWWQRHGEKRFVETFAIDPTLEDATSVNAEAEKTTVAEDKEMQEAIDAYIPEEAEKLIKTEETEENEDKEVNDVLQEISELLETLHSYQRIRNSALPATTRAPAANQKPSLPWLAESPTIPSTAEFDTYGILKDQLRLLIASLPPSAVAKLNGEQLEDLNIKQTINIENKNYRGTMEEHQATRYAKAATLNPPIGPTRSSSSLGQVQYSSTAQYGRTPLPQTGTRATQATQGYYPQQQPPNRSPSLNFSQRPSSGNSQTYNTPTQPSRTSYSTSYSQSRPGQQSYGGVPNSGNYNYNQQYSAATPVSRAQNGAGYPPRPSSSIPPAYPTPTAGTYHRVSSPHSKAPPTYPNNSRQSYPPSYGTASTSIPPAGKQSSPSTPNPTSAPPQAHSATGPSGYHTYQTSQEQQLMLDRQKAQLAMQPQARASAQAGALKGEASEQQDTKMNGVAA